MSDDPFAPLGPSDKPRRKAAPSPAEWISVVPVPDDAPPPPQAHPRTGRPAKVWQYLDAGGRLLGLVQRFETGEGKTYRPCCLFRHLDGGLEWRWESWPEPRPLYGLDALAARPAALVMVCEGEKAADAAAQLGDWVAVTSPAGAKSAAKANWQPLSGRDVVVWPDADEPGAKYAMGVAKLLALAGAASVRILEPPTGVTPGWDAADALAAGWTRDQVRELVASARGPGERAAAPAGSSATGEVGSGDRGRPRQRDALLSAADTAVLWHSPEKVPYATVPVNGHHEHYRLDSVAFRRWLAGRFYEATGNAAAGQMLADALRVLEVRAIESGACHRPAMRTAWHDGCSWLDLCDATWRAVRVRGDGWDVVDDPPVKFIRTETMMALPEPEPGSMIESLRGFVNAEEEDYRLIVAWLVGALWGRATAYPVLAVGGEQGSGKTTMVRMLRAIVDPSAVAALALPRDERDLFTMAMSGHVQSFDNVSKVDAWFSDAICRLATGAGFLTRKLHSDAEPFWFQGSRPCILNGIPSLTERADLAERSLTVRLQRIDEETREAEDDWWRRWDAALPGILGALLDAISAAVRTYDQVKLRRMPRMAAFAKLMTSAEGALGWDEGDFLRAYEDNRKATTDAVFESDPVAVAIFRFISNRDPAVYEGMWEGTATMLLAELNAIVGDEVRHSRFWPAKVNALGNAVDRAAPLLRHKGLHVTKRTVGNQRMILLTLKPGG